VHWRQSYTGALYLNGKTETRCQLCTVETSTRYSERFKGIQEKPGDRMVFQGVTEPTGATGDKGDKWRYRSYWRTVFLRNPTVKKVILVPGSTNGTNGNDGATGATGNRADGAARNPSIPRCRWYCMEQNGNDEQPEQLVFRESKVLTVLRR